MEESKIGVVLGIRLDYPYDKKGRRELKGPSEGPII